MRTESPCRAGKCKGSASCAHASCAPREPSTPRATTPATPHAAAALRAILGHCGAMREFAQVANPTESQSRDFENCKNLRTDS
jgi:hypothetical protein